MIPIVTFCIQLKPQRNSNSKAKSIRVPTRRQFGSFSLTVTLLCLEDVKGFKEPWHPSWLLCQEVMDLGQTSLNLKKEGSSVRRRCWCFTKVIMVATEYHILRMCNNGQNVLNSSDMLSGHLMAEELIPWIKFLYLDLKSKVENVQWISKLLVAWCLSRKLPIALHFVFVMDSVRWAVLSPADDQTMFSWHLIGKLIFSNCKRLPHGWRSEGKSG